MAIGKKLDALLKARGKKPGTLATETGISKNTIYAIIKRDNEKVSMAVLERIADALQVSIDYFFDKEYLAVMDSRKYPISDEVRNRVVAELENADKTDVDAARVSMDVDLLDRIAKGEGAVAIDDAIEASDMLGITLSDLLGIQNSAPAEEPERDRITNLFLSLSEENQKKLIDYAILLLTAQQAGRDSQG